MARQARLVVPGLAHYVVLRGHSQRQVFADELDRQAFVQVLRITVQAQPVLVHAAALLDGEVHLLARPAEAIALSRCIQALGRHYVPAYNRRHGGSGTLWDGRFRAAVVEPGEATLLVLSHIDGLRLGTDASSTNRGRSGEVTGALFTDPPELWALGNTPFEREAAYRRRLSQPLSLPMLDALAAAIRGGRAFGGAEFLAALAAQTGRAVHVAARGRPRRAQCARPASQ